MGWLGLSRSPSEEHMEPNNAQQEPITEGAESSATLEQAANAAPAQSPPVQTTEPPPPAPTAPAVNPEIESLKAQLAEQRALMTQMLQARDKPQAPAPAPEVDVQQWIKDNVADNSQALFAEFANVLEKQYARKFASRDEYATTQQTAAEMAARYAEQQAQDNLKARNVPESDIAEVRKRIWEKAQANPGKQLWDSAEQAYKETLADLLLDRQYANADKAKAAKDAVKQRQQAQVQPQPQAPAGTGKPKLDYKALKKQMGRPLTVAELMEAHERARA